MVPRFDHNAALEDILSNRTVAGLKPTHVRANSFAAQWSILQHLCRELNSIQNTEGASIIRS
jgi:hypothetical protein